MTADTLDLSPEAVERLARRLLWAFGDSPLAAEAAALIRAQAAEIERLTAENDRLRAERDAAWQAGAEAMREAAADEALRIDADVFNENYATSFNRKRYDQHGVMRCTNRALNIQAEDAAAAIRALPMPGQPKDGGDVR